MVCYNFVNPRTIGYTEPFQVSTFDNAGNLLEHSPTQNYMFISKASPITALTTVIGPLPPTTASNPNPIFNITFNFTLVAPVQANDIFTFKLPSYVTVTTASSCFAPDNNN